MRITLFFLLTIICNNALAQFDSTFYEMSFPLESTTYDTINTDLAEDESTFYFKILDTSRKLENKEIQILVSRGMRAIRNYNVVIHFSEQHIGEFSIPILIFREGDDIRILDDNFSHIITPVSFYKKKLAENRASKQYPVTLKFESHLYENTKEIKLDTSLVSFCNVATISNYHEYSDSLVEKKINDSSYFISSVSQIVKYSLNEDIYRYWWKDYDSMAYFARPDPIRIYDELHKIYYPNFYCKNVLVVVGRMDRDTFKSLRRKWRKQLKSNRALSVFFKSNPMLLVLNYDSWRKKDTWLYYSIVLTEDSVLIKSKKDTSISYYEYYRR